MGAGGLGGFAVSLSRSWTLCGWVRFQTTTWESTKEMVEGVGVEGVGGSDLFRPAPL